MGGRIATGLARHRARWLLAPAMLALAACGGAPEQPKPALRISAAASMTGVLEPLMDEFGQAELTANYGSSSDLARSLKSGYPADLYISASSKWARYMEQEDLLTGKNVVFAKGVLVCVAPEESTLQATSLQELAAALHDQHRIAVGNEGVPAGDYSREAFKLAGVADRFTARLIGLLDVRAVLKAVADGEADCGFVYATDARGTNVRTLFDVDAKLHEPIEYYICVVKHGEQAELAQAFIDFLRGEKGRALLREAGFIIPD